MKNDTDKHIEFFKKLHEVTGDIVQSFEKEDEKEIESAIGRFIMLMLQADSFK
jgi:hypothetical protein